MFYRGVRVMSDPRSKPANFVVGVIVVVFVLFFFVWAASALLLTGQDQEWPWAQKALHGLGLADKSKYGYALNEHGKGLRIFVWVVAGAGFAAFLASRWKS